MTYNWFEWNIFTCLVFLNKLVNLNNIFLNAESMSSKMTAAPFTCDF